VTVAFEEDGETEIDTRDFPDEVGLIYKYTYTYVYANTCIYVYMYIHI
jgi:hypothetical protein